MCVSTFSLVVHCVDCEEIHLNFLNFFAIHARTRLTVFLTARPRGRDVIDDVTASLSSSNEISKNSNSRDGVLGSESVVIVVKKCPLLCDGDGKGFKLHGIKSSVNPNYTAL